MQPKLLAIVRNVLAGTALALLPSFAIAADALTSLHPEEAYPDNAPRLSLPGRYDDLNKRVQQKLHEQGFDAGPVNGDFGAKTQAALTQFQLSRALPASGMLDEETLAALGLERDRQTPESGSPSSGN
jgi:peptidoglycan hydrolase-like protein with peptidoglycan-binding domain